VLANSVRSVQPENAVKPGSINFIARWTAIVEKM